MNGERPSYRREIDDNGLEHETEAKRRKLFDGNEGFIRRSEDGCPCCQTRQFITVHDEVRIVNYLIVNGQVLRALDLEIWKTLAKTILPEGHGPSPFALYHRFFLKILPRYKIFPLSKELEQQFEELLQRSQGLFTESSNGCSQESALRWTLNSGGIGTPPRRGEFDDNGESIIEFKTPDKNPDGVFIKTSPKSSKKGRNYTREEDQALFNLLICYNMIKRGGYRRTWEEIANQGAPGLEKRTAASMHSRYSVIRQNYEQYIDDPDTRAVFREVEEERVKVEAKRKPVKVE